ncbi:MAG TPA: DnaJ domain-containing protein [Thermomonas sp.]|nr:DnaJ domain-containing protein [Thermomonas sp.]
MSPFEILGLDATADVATIKRAYARLLRTHRPDDDAAAFQRLHEAYEACMEQARWREQGWYDEDEGKDDGDGIDASDIAKPAPVGEPGDATFAPLDAAGMAANADADAFVDHGIDMPGTEDFDVGAFSGELVGRMRSDTRQAVEAWLQANDDLYSLERKHAMQAVVIDALESVDAATASRHFETLTRFFGMDMIAGIDGWLQHRLDDLQRRLGDTAEFERVLRTHAGADATWADRGIARELLEPFRWLRRLCLIACPGLPGRTGALARALHAADPESASARLDQQARHFWERATDRGALHRERLGFSATRFALWSLALALLVATTGDDKGYGKGFLLDWAAFFGWVSGLWLAYALVVCGLMRLRAYNQSRMQWDWLLLMTTLGLACGVAAVAAGGSGILPFLMTTIAWVGARNDGEQGSSASQGASLAAGASGYGLAFLVLHQSAGGAVEMRYLACIAAVYAFAAQVLNDVLFARRRGITLVRARMQAGWLWRLFQVQGVLLLAIVVGLSVFRQETAS